MRDLIDRQAAIDALFELYEYQRDIDPTEAADLVRQGVFLAEKKIEGLPSAERKGHWIDLKCGSASLWKCSECGELFLEDFYYCPNCGADMRGGNDG